MILRQAKPSGSIAVPLANLEEKSRLTEAVQRSGREGAKRGFDICTACLAIVLLSPLFILMICSVLAMQGRPLFIRHKRVGRGGRHFQCLKFRTMVVNGDEVLERHLQSSPAARAEWDASRKLKDDPRVTPLGKVLRKTSVDELPQLINVLRGEMSLVGPRPIVDAEVKHYGPNINQYYKVRPGITGLWQVSGRSDVSYNARVKLDVAYVENCSLSRDIAILLRTVPAVLGSKGSY